MKRLLYILLFIPGICFSQIVINDLPSGGAIGTAANTVNKGSLFHVNQTTSGQTLTVPNPTATNFSKFIYVLDIGSASFTLSPGGNLTPGTGVILVWTGTNWNVAGNGSPPTSYVTQSITNGDVSFSPSGDAVFDALALKQDVFTSQTANKFYASPNGSSGVPSFRSIVAADIPTLNQNTTGNAATVTTIPTLSGDVSNTGNNVSVSGSVVKSIVLNTPNVLYTTPINFSTLSSTATGTLSLNTQSANTVFAGPSTGSAATPTFRSLVVNDLPTIPNTKISGLGGAATLNVGTASGTVCAGDDNRIKGFNIINYSNAFNPADATTYYLGSVGTLHVATGGVTSIARRKYINVTGTITSAQVYIINNTTDASTETSTLYIRINDATDYTISTGIQFSSTSSGKVYNITGLSIPVTAGDYEVSKLVTATWATNPAQSHMEIVYYIQ